MEFRRVLLTVAELELLTGLHRSTINRDIKSGKLKSRHLKGGRRIEVADAEAYVGVPLFQRAAAE